MDHPLVLAADRYAEEAHAEVGQVRGYTGLPYITHPRAVMRFLSQFTDDPEDLAAALLHDVVEDTKRTLEMIRETFGAGVAYRVDGLANKTTQADGNRAFRVRMEAERLSRQDARVQTIKACDVWHNTLDLVTQDPKRAKSYISEKVIVVTTGLTKADPRVLAIVQVHLGRCLRRLGMGGVAEGVETAEPAPALSAPCGGMAVVGPSRRFPLLGASRSASVDSSGRDYMFGNQLKETRDLALDGGAPQFIFR